MFQDPCSLPKNVGPCDGRVEQFWYNKEKDECFTFDWGEFHFKVKGASIQSHSTAVIFSNKEVKDF